MTFSKDDGTVAHDKTAICNSTHKDMQTKSIINTHAQSGAVVSNTPEPGLKRAPIVTFSSNKIYGDEPTAQGPTDLKNTNISNNGINAFSSKKSDDILQKTLSENAIKEQTGNALNILTSPVTIKTTEVAEEHPHFIVDDALHSPTHISRSNSRSPRPSIIMNSFSGTNLNNTSNIIDVGIPIPVITHDATAKSHILSMENTTGESILIESVMEHSILKDKHPKLHKPVIPASKGPSNTELMITTNTSSSMKSISSKLPQDDGRLHVLFGATGSLAVFKLKPMIKKLEEVYGKEKISIQVILTQTASRFFMRKPNKKGNTVNNSISITTTNSTVSAESTPLLNKQSTDLNTNYIQSPENLNLSQIDNGTCNVNACNIYKISGAELPSHIQVWIDQDEWDYWDQKTDPPLHIELRRWADILVVAPLTANTLSKFSLGLCDNLLTNVFRAWNPHFPILLAPSMISSTYNSAITKKQLASLGEDMPWVTVFKPSEKVIGINGDIGLGGMMDWNEIVDKIIMKLGGYPEDEEQEETEDDDNDDEDAQIEGGNDEEEDEEDEEDGEDDDEYDDDGNTNDHTTLVEVQN